MSRLTNPGWIRSAIEFAALLLVVSAISSVAQAQADPTAIRTLAVSAFGGAQRLWPDYGHAGNGYMFGADVTRYYRLVQPSIEVRYTHGSGDAVTEHTFGGGIKAEKAMGPGYRVHPYVEARIAAGVIDFKYPNPITYTSDNSKVLGMGGGLDFDLTSRFAVKGDYQYEYWSLGKNDTLNPHSISVGLVYRIPFGSYRMHP